MRHLDTDWQAIIAVARETWGDELSRIDENGFNAIIGSIVHGGSVEDRLFRSGPGFPADASAILENGKAILEVAILVWGLVQMGRTSREAILVEIENGRNAKFKLRIMGKLDGRRLTILINTITNAQQKRD